MSREKRLKNRFFSQNHPRICLYRRSCQNSRLVFRRLSKGRNPVLFGCCRTGQQPQIPDIVLFEIHPKSGGATFGRAVFFVGFSEPDGGLFFGKTNLPPLAICIRRQYITSKSSDSGKESARDADIASRDQRRTGGAAIAFSLRGDAGIFARRGPGDLASAEEHLHEMSR